MSLTNIEEHKNFFGVFFGVPRLCPRPMLLPSKKVSVWWRNMGGHIHGALQTSLQERVRRRIFSASDSPASLRAVFSMIRDTLVFAFFTSISHDFHDMVMNMFMFIKMFHTVVMA